MYTAVIDVRAATAAADGSNCVVDTSSFITLLLSRAMSSRYPARRRLTDTSDTAQTTSHVFHTISKRSLALTKTEKSQPRAEPEAAKYTSLTYSKWIWIMKGNNAVLSFAASMLTEEYTIAIYCRGASTSLTTYHVHKDTPNT